MEIPEIGFGTYPLTGTECVEAVRTALEVGYRHVDTAQYYDNESAVGEAVAAADVDRDDVFLATKVWRDRLGYDDFVASTRRSLDRLGVDSVDLLYVHWPMQTYDPDETLAALDDLHDEGVVDHVGLSNFTPSLLDEARETLDAPVYAHQVEVHPLCRQTELRAYAAEAGHHLVAYCPVARNRVAEVPEVVTVAERHGVTPAQASLAWLMAKDVVPIPNSSSPEHIRENLAARDVELDASDVERIDSIAETERLVEPTGAPWTV